LENVNWKKVKKIVEFIVSLLSFLLGKGKKEEEEKTKNTE